MSERDLTPSAPSPTPWAIDALNHEYLYFLKKWDSDPDKLLRNPIIAAIHKDIKDADLEFILRAVNNHTALKSLIGEMVGALENFANIKADDGDTFDKYDEQVVIKCEITVKDLKTARAVLAKAREKLNG